MSRSTRFRPSGVPPLRETPFEPDAHDDNRVEFLKNLWHSQDDKLRSRDRQVEENIRMLLGQQWIVWSELQQRFVNLADHLSDDEKRWRHMPTLNRIFKWFMLTHARATENPPIVTFQPGPDRIDSMLAEVMDPVYKHVWREAGMMDAIDWLVTWMIPCGMVYGKSRIDLTKGRPIENRGPAILQLVDAEGDPVLLEDGSPIQREASDVPFGPDGPLARFVSDGDDERLEELGQPDTFHEGGVEFDPLICLEVRAEWGAEHHKAGWHIHRSFLTPMQAYEAFGTEIEPDVTGASGEDLGVFMRLLHGTGLFGSAEGKRSANLSPGDEFVTVYEGWWAPSRFPGMQSTPTSPGGRLLTVTGGGEVVRDGVRTARFRYTSPIRRFDFVRLPGRQHGSSPQEQMNGPSRTRNRFHGQLFAHASLSANPLQILDRSQGMEEGQVKNLPGQQILANRKPGHGPPVEYASVPSLGSEVMEAADRLQNEIDDLGSLPGTEGSPPTDDASGELVKELRSNSDRFLGPTMRRFVVELARVTEDWIAMLPTIWDEEKIISVAGEDGIARTVTVYPHLFEQGSVNAHPEIESMLPEGRGERQARVLQFWREGLFGDPTSPQAINIFLDRARFPHMSRLVRPGGVDRTTAEQVVGKLLQGAQAAELPIFPWYDFDMHLWVLERFMKSPEYLKIEPEIQQQFFFHWQTLKQATVFRAVQEAQEQASIQGGAAAAAMGATAEIEGALTEGAPPEEEAPPSRDVVA